MAIGRSDLGTVTSGAQAEAISSFLVQNLSSAATFEVLLKDDNRSYDFYLDYN